jgi:hypothetical protein
VTDLAMSGVFDLSPDGKFVAFAMLEHAGEHKKKLAVVSTDSGQVLKRLDFERPRFGLVRFNQDGKAVVYPTGDKGIDICGSNHSTAPRASSSPISARSVSGIFTGPLMAAS